MSSNQQDTSSLFHQEKTRKQRLLTVLKAKVVLLREQLETAENECKTLEAELARNLSPITYPRASIRDLPTETLLEIFTLSILERHRDIGNLLFVCKQWNAIVMNSPNLWDTISITFTLQKSKFEKEFAYCTDCIERSGGRLLAVSITSVNLYEEFPFSDPSEDDACIESLWNSFKIHDDVFLKRYKSFHVHLPISHLNNDFLSPLFTRYFPNLTCLSLPYFYPNSAFSQFLGKTPLKVLTMADGLTIYDFGSLLNALQVLDCYVDQILGDLSSIYSLESLTLRRDDDDDHWPHLRGVILLPRLRALTLLGVFPDKILSRIELPALSYLTFVTHGDVSTFSKLKAKPSALYWELASRTISPTIDNNFVSNISQIIRHYDSVKTMRVPLCAGNFVLGAFKSLANQGEFSVELLGTRVLDDDSILLEMDISTGSS